MVPLRCVALGEEIGSSYSRAQRYGSNARILGRAHVCKLKGEAFGAIASFGDVFVVLMMKETWRLRLTHIENIYGWA